MKQAVSCQILWHASFACLSSSAEYMKAMTRQYFICESWALMSGYFTTLSHLIHFPSFVYWMQFALPHLMGWDQCTTNQLPHRADKGSTRAVPELLSSEWDR